MSAKTAKRLSLNTGPRPLHLVDLSLSHSNSPASTSLSFSSRTALHSPPLTPLTRLQNGERPTARRQSSISYNTRGSNGPLRSPLGSNRPGRSNSLGTQAPHKAPSKAEIFNPARVEPPQRAPLTLAEKHVELLHFIAQKEAKCLELRSQLTTHETELAELKRKWERIVNRGYEKDNDMTLPANNGAVLENIREGVQGVSRLIAAGLNITDSKPSSPSSPSPTLASLPHRRTHSTRESDSSMSTYTTKSTRFSQSSSASSIEEESPVQPTSEDTTLKRDVQILMVRDTGATPMMSPNPEFHTQKEKQRVAEEANLQLNALGTDFEGADAFTTSSAITTTKMCRRRSRDAKTLEDNLSSPVQETSMNLRTPFNQPSPSPAVDASRQGNRISIPPSSFPPVASIPGFHSLARVGAGSPSSWVGSMGKKWDELQKNTTFTKGQKRASVLFSDVSQTIASALAPLPPSPSPSAVKMSPVRPSASTTAAPTNTGSLLDDDDDFMESTVLQPDSASIAGTQLKPSPGMLSPRSLAKTRVPHVQGKAHPQFEPQEDDDEWNW